MDRILNVVIEGNNYAVNVDEDLINTASDLFYKMELRFLFKTQILGVKLLSNNRNGFKYNRIFGSIQSIRFCFTNLNNFLNSLNNFTKNRMLIV